MLTRSQRWLLPILALLVILPAYGMTPQRKRILMGGDPLSRGLIFRAPLRTGLVATPSNPTPTYTRASSGTFLGSNGLIQTATSGVPRFDYGAAGNAVPGALIEAQVTNLALQSQTFANATWLTGRLTDTDNVAVGPDGTSDAARLQETAVTGTHVTEQEIAVTNTTVYTWTVYLKAAERTWAQLYYNGASVRRMFVNLSTGTLGTVDAQFTARVVNVGNGWYRVSGSLAADETATVGFGIGVATGDTVTSYAGDATKGIDADGAQLETGSVATSAIPTTNATVTRAADVLTYPAAGNISATVGSVSVWAMSPLDGSKMVSSRLFFCGASNLIDCVKIFTSANTLTFQALSDTSGSFRGLEVTLDSGNWTAYTWHHLAMSWTSAGITAAWLDGVPVTTVDNVGVWTDMISLGTTIGIGKYTTSSANVWNGSIRDARIYNRVLSATEVSTLKGLGY